MQQESKFSTSTNSTAPEGSESAVKSKRSLHLHSPAALPRQHVFMQKKSDPLAPTVSVDDGVGGDASEAASQQDQQVDKCPAPTHGRTMSWLPFPAMNAAVSWTDLADSDDDDLGWNLQPVAHTEETAAVDDPLQHNDGTIPVSGPLIPSFSGQSPGVSTAVAGDAQSDLSTTSLGRFESPTPVAVMQDLSSASKHPSRTQFGFALGSALSSTAALGRADGFLGADSVTGSASQSQWGGRLQNSSIDNVPELVVEAKLEAVHPVNSDERVVTMVQEAKEGLAAGCPPNAPREGTGGTYFLSDASGSHVGIFKPCDEEPLAPNNPKGWNSRSMSDPGMKPSVRVGEAALREVAAFLLDHDGFAGVPPACLVAVSHQNLNYAAQPATNSSTPGPFEEDAMGPIAALSPLDAPPQQAYTSLCATESSAASSHSPVSAPTDSRLTAPAVPGGVKLGSLQAFAEHTCDANDIASSRFSADSVHRVGILDVRLLNLDRHAGNLLVAEAPRGTSSSGGDRGPAPLHKLVPIDHGFALPEALDDPYFEWQYWTQASVPFSPEVKAYVEALDGAADVAMLQEELPALRPECLRCLLVTTTVLKRCVAANMTLSEIAGIFTRAKASEASDFEAICMDAREDALAHATLPSLPSLTLSDYPVIAQDHTSGHPSACLGGPFPFDEASGELSPQSSLAMSGLIGSGLVSGTVSCEASPFKPLPTELVSESPMKGNAQAAESPCMLAAASIFCGTPATGSALPSQRATPSWLCTAELGPHSPHSPTFVAPTKGCFHPPAFTQGCRLGDPAAADIRRSDQGMSIGGLGCYLSARTNISSRTVWHSKRRGRNGSNLPNLLSAVHPDKANYVFSGLSEGQWSVFLSRVEDFVDEEICKGTWTAADCGPVAGSCPEPVKSRKF